MAALTAASWKYSFCCLRRSLAGFAPDDELRAHHLNAVCARRFAKRVGDLPRGHHRRLEHAALDELVNVQKLFGLCHQRLRDAALADDERRVDRIGLCAKLGPFLTCHVLTSFYCVVPRWVHRADRGVRPYMGVPFVWKRRSEAASAPTKFCAPQISVSFCIC